MLYPSQGGQRGRRCAAAFRQAPDEAFVQYRGASLGMMVRPRCRDYLESGFVHHCCSHGTPSLLPSICVPGQFLRKYFASVQDVI